MAMIYLVGSIFILVNKHGLGGRKSGVPLSAGIIGMYVCEDSG